MLFCTRIPKQGSTLPEFAAAVIFSIPIEYVQIIVTCMTKLALAGCSIVQKNIFRRGAVFSG